jgi:hypothetical protein
MLPHPLLLCGGAAAAQAAADALATACWVARFSAAARDGVGGIAVSLEADGAGGAQLCFQPAEVVIHGSPRQLERQGVTETAVMSPELPRRAAGTDASPGVGSCCSLARSRVPQRLSSRTGAHGGAGSSSCGVADELELLQAAADVEAELRAELEISLAAARTAAESALADAANMTEQRDAALRNAREAAASVDALVDELQSANARAQAAEADAQCCNAQLVAAWDDITAQLRSSAPGTAGRSCSGDRDTGAELGAAVELLAEDLHCSRGDGACPSASAPAREQSEDGRVWSSRLRALGGALTSALQECNVLRSELAEQRSTCAHLESALREARTRLPECSALTCRACSTARPPACWLQRARLPPL